MSMKKENVKKQMNSNLKSKAHLTQKSLSNNVRAAGKISACLKLHQQWQVRQTKRLQRLDSQLIMRYASAPESDESVHHL